MYNCTKIFKIIYYDKKFNDLIKEIFPRFECVINTLLNILIKLFLI